MLWNMNLAKSGAEAIARDILDARRKLLRRMTLEERYSLLRLSDDLKEGANVLAGVAVHPVGKRPALPGQEPGDRGSQSGSISCE
jgi:hypothetical protein